MGGHAHLNLSAAGAAAPQPAGVAHLTLSGEGTLTVGVAVAALAGAVVIKNPTLLEQAVQAIDRLPIPAQLLIVDGVHDKVVDTLHDPRTELVAAAIVVPLLAFVYRSARRRQTR